VDLAETLTDWIVADPGRRGRLGWTVGLAAPQGAGKSTLAARLVQRLADRGLRAVTLSLDDLYLTRAERETLGREAHPLLRTRGPPGTHDVGLGLRVLASLTNGREATLPRFDKGIDDRSPEVATIAAPVDVILFEGWCVGARPQPPEALVGPVNTLERDEDPDGRWRQQANAALARAYQTLWGRLDRLVLLRPPDWSTVVDWRLEAERKLRAAGDPAGAPRAMGDNEVRRFVQHFERLTRHLLAEGPARADVVVDLDAERRPVAFRFRERGLEA
jgi:D-glycerate 3-kinase